jgi:hypothetical protein
MAPSCSQQSLGYAHLSCADYSGRREGDTGIHLLAIAVVLA